MRKLAVALLRKLQSDPILTPSIVCSSIFYHLLKILRSKHENFPTTARLPSIAQLSNSKLSFRASLKKLNIAADDMGDGINLVWKPLILLGRLKESEKPEQLNIEDATGSIPCLVIHAHPGLLGQWVLFDRWSLVLSCKQAPQSRYFEIDCRNAQVRQLILFILHFTINLS